MLLQRKIETLKVSNESISTTLLDIDYINAIDTIHQEGKLLKFRFNGITKRLDILSTIEPNKNINIIYWVDIKKLRKQKLKEIKDNK